MQQQLTFQIDSGLYDFLNLYSSQTKKPIHALFEDFVKNLSLRSYANNLATNTEKNENNNQEINKFIHLVKQFNSIEEIDLDIDNILNERNSPNERKFSFD